jgi:hypothetical protein
MIGEFTFRPFDSGEVAIRNVFLGATPIILIEPVEGDGSVEDDEDVKINVDCTGLDRQELGDLLLVLAAALRSEDETR